MAESTQETDGQVETSSDIWPCVDSLETSAMRTMRPEDPEWPYSTREKCKIKPRACKQRDKQRLKRRQVQKHPDVCVHRRTRGVAGEVETSLKASGHVYPKQTKTSGRQLETSATRRGTTRKAKVETVVKNTHAVQRTQSGLQRMLRSGRQMETSATGRKTSRETSGDRWK